MNQDITNRILKSYVGKTYDNSLKDQIQKEVGESYAIYSIPAMSIVTADYRTDRIRITLKEDNTIVGIRIG